MAGTALDFFSPFAFLLFVATWLVYGRRVAWRVFPAFCAAGAVYLAYQGVNWAVTGYATGMPRHAAPEAPLLLIRQFLTAFGWSGLKLAIAAALLCGLARCARRREDEDRRAATLVLMAGLAFLALWSMRERPLRSHEMPVAKAAEEATGETLSDADFT